ncbi:MAG: ABC transporter permease [Acidimicrobiia bacterium]
MSTTLVPSRLHPADLGRTAAVGLRTRKLRAGLSALGIMIGIASMVAVLGLSESSKSDLLAQLDRLGTNLLTVQAGQGIGRGTGQLPAEAASMVARIGPVETTSAVSSVDANAYRSDFIPVGQTGGITVQAVDTHLLATVGGSIAEGRFLNEATAGYPTAVLGSVTAERMGIHDLAAQPRILVGDRWFSVIGILEQFELSPDLDRAVLVGLPASEDYLGHDPVPSTIHVRTNPAFVDDVMSVLAATTNPENPEEVEVARPSDALEAREAADDAFTALFLGLGAVALLVGGVGIANVMVISVLERRAEIGLRRALGATRRHVGVQFLGEALLLAIVGGVGGVALGWAVTAGYANFKGWDTLVPSIALFGGVGAAVGIGAIAGLYPAIRASRLSPTEALRSG